MNGFSKHKVFFIGVGGIGMSALARWFKANGFETIGYDKTSTQLTNQLLEEGILVHYKDSLDFIPEDFTVEQTLVIYTPAIPQDHNQLNYFKDQGYEIRKRAEVLGIISRNMFSIGVAGTHGKTTTSSMIAHILNHAGVDTTAFLGGIATNFNSNLLLGKSEKTIAVIEADEYDRSFLQLNPDIEVITSASADHLDIYGDESAMLASFEEFVGCLKKEGTCFIATKAQDKLGVNEAIVYGETGRISAANIRIDGSRYHLDYVDGDLVIKNIQLNLPGAHNVENALAAIAVSRLLGIDDEAIMAAMIDFKGIKRRFEYIIEEDDLKFIDDYAHHPEEVAAFIGTLRKLYPEASILVIFQPHLFSRTKDFAAEFAQSLSIADEVLLMDIYPARELPMAGVTSELILDKISREKKQILDRSKICDYVAMNTHDVVATIGAGNIDALVTELKETLTKTIAA